jgi:hypothetical protein
VVVGEITARLRQESSFVNFDHPIETDDGVKGREGIEKSSRIRMPSPRHPTLRDTDPKSSENTEKKSHPLLSPYKDSSVHGKGADLGLFGSFSDHFSLDLTEQMTERIDQAARWELGARTDGR